jgi:hypothetical protein
MQEDEHWFTLPDPFDVDIQSMDVDKLGIIICQFSRGEGAFEWWDWNKQWPNQQNTQPTC